MDNFIPENMIPFAKQQMETIKALPAKKFNRMSTKAIRAYINQFNEDGYLVATAHEMKEAGLLTSIQNPDDSIKYAWGLMMPTLPKEKITAYAICEAKDIPGAITIIINPCQLSKIEKMIAATIETASRMEDNGNDDAAEKFRGIVSGMSYVLDTLGLKAEFMDEVYNA